LEDCELIDLVQFEPSLLDPEAVREDLRSDRLFRRIMQRVISGSWSRCSEAEMPFKEKAQRLTIENGLLYMGPRLFVPPRFRRQAFNAAHLECHSGYRSTLQRLILSSWWPGMMSLMSKDSRATATRASASAPA
jgi:hypothetical protein